MENRRGANRNKPNSKNRNVNENRSKKSGFKTSGSYKKDPNKRGPNPNTIKRENSGVAKRSLDGKVRLNRFLAQAGICSRREADELISTGAVEINGNIVIELGTKVDPHKDVVRYGGQKISVEKNRYILVNKPKDFTTSSSVNSRKTVMDLVSNACIETVYPIDRLDKNSLGLLILTNDAQLLDKLTSSKFPVRKTYQVEVTKPISKGHFNELLSGTEVDGMNVKVDSIDYGHNGTDKTSAILTLKYSKNKIIDKIFEHFGYRVTKIDRVGLAGLDKKGLQRGKWRHLTDQEVGFLKMK
jgi:23S rRNA pseudouridine2605 synthase